MKSRFLVRVAATALLGAAGAAQAADVIVVGVGPTEPPTVVGPTVEIDISATFGIDYYSDGYLYVGGGIGGDLDVLSASGWGIRLWGGSSVSVFPVVGYGASLAAEVYRAIGNAQVGFYIAPYGFNPIDISFGPTFRYETETIEFYHTTAVDIWNAGDWRVELDNELTVALNEQVEVGGWLYGTFGTNGPYFSIAPMVSYRSETTRFEHWTQIGVWVNGWDVDLDTEIERRLNERLKVGGYFDLVFGTGGTYLYAGGEATVSLSDRLDLIGYADLGLDGGGVWYGVGAGLELDLGAFEPYAYVGWDPASVDFNFGFDFEKQLGTGPLRLIGNGSAWIAFAGGLDYGVYTTIGLRYLIGEDDEEDDDL